MKTNILAAVAIAFAALSAMLVYQTRGDLAEVRTENAILAAKIDQEVKDRKEDREEQVDYDLGLVASIGAELNRIDENMDDLANSQDTTDDFQDYQIREASKWADKGLTPPAPSFLNAATLYSNGFHTEARAVANAAMTNILGNDAYSCRSVRDLEPFGLGNVSQEMMNLLLSGSNYSAQAVKGQYGTDLYKVAVYPFTSAC